LPAIVSGRNARCAWGITALSAVVADLYADSLSRDGKQVRWRGGWARVREAPYEMSFRVLGVPLPVWLAGQVRRYTPHGPIIARDRKRGVALSVRWSGATDEVDLGALLGIERSRSAADV
jgi:acyl-homoserine lactone acylase PvdQ